MALANVQFEYSTNWNLKSRDEYLVDRDNKDVGKDVGNDGSGSDGGGEGSYKVVGKLKKNDWF